MSDKWPKTLSIKSTDENMCALHSVARVGTALALLQSTVSQVWKMIVWLKMFSRYWELSRTHITLCVTSLALSLDIWLKAKHFSLTRVNSTLTYSKVRVIKLQKIKKILTLKAQHNTYEALDFDLWLKSYKITKYYI